jgi:hypothetical protein
MPDPNITRVNRVPYSGNSCANFFNGLPYKGVRSTTFKETRELKLVHGAQQDGTPLGLTAGVYKIDNLSFTLLRDSAMGLLADLTLLGAGSYGDAEFMYMLQVFEPTLVPALPIQTVITGCRITGVEETQELGPGGAEELVTKFDAMALYLVRTYGGNPLQLWSAVRSLL